MSTWPRCGSSHARYAGSSSVQPLRVLWPTWTAGKLTSCTNSTRDKGNICGFSFTAVDIAVLCADKARSVAALAPALRRVEHVPPVTGPVRKVEGLARPDTGVLEQR